jgi:hypothetical protein
MVEARRFRELIFQPLFWRSADPVVQEMDAKKLRTSAWTSNECPVERKI